MIRPLVVNAIRCRLKPTTLLTFNRLPKNDFGQLLQDWARSLNLAESHLKWGPIDVFCPTVESQKPHGRNLVREAALVADALASVLLAPPPAPWLK